MCPAFAGGLQCGVWSRVASRPGPSCAIEGIKGSDELIFALLEDLVDRERALLDIGLVGVEHDGWRITDSGGVSHWDVSRSDASRWVRTTGQS